MLSVEDRYYKFYRIVMKLLGLWPYQQSKWTSVQMITLTTLYLSGIFVQLAVLITHEWTMEITLKVLSNIFPSIASLVLYNMYYFNSNVMKEIMEHIYYDWKCLKRKTELAIWNNYAGLTKLLTDIAIFWTGVVVIVSVMLRAVPIILDFVLPLNASRVHVNYIETEYFVDKNKYSHSLVWHMVIFICLEIITAVVIGLAFYSYASHACAMFKVANYRMEITMAKNVLRMPNLEMEHVIYERIVCAINIHRRAIKYTELVMSSIEKPFLFLIVIGVTSLSISLFRLLYSITTSKDIVEILVPFGLVVGHFCYMFLGNHIGQQITDNNAEIFNTVYSVPWYIAPINIQRLILFLLQKGNRNVYLTVGGMYNASYETFTKLVTSSISYFTVIHTMQ